MAQSLAGLPSFSAARLTPSARRFPKPWRWLIIWINRAAPLMSPHLSRNPSCPSAMYPFSWHSITQPREVHHPRQRAVLVERLRGGAGTEIEADVVGGLHEPARVRRPQRLRPAHDGHRLELLLAHDRAAAVLGGDVAVVTLDGGEAREVLPRGPDRVHREHVAAQAELRAERVLGRPRVFAEEVAGIAELHDVVVDVEIDPVRRVPLDDDRVVARVLQVRAEEAVGLRRGRTVGSGADRHDGEAARAPGRQPRHGPGGHDQTVVGVIPGEVALAALRRGLAIEDHGAEADAADQLPHRVGAPRLGPALLLREVHAQELTGVAVLRLARGARGRLFARSPKTRCGHTATGVFPGALDGRPRMVSGSSALVVFDAMKAGLMSNGLRVRYALKRASETPDCTSPLSMPTSLVVQMSLDGPRMIAPVSRSPRQRRFR